MAALARRWVDWLGRIGQSLDGSYCVFSLSPRDNHVPFRNSKLTQLLADSLSGQAKCMMFMHVSPEGSFASETVSTLNFGSKVSTITLGQVRFEDFTSLWSVYRCTTDHIYSDEVVALGKAFP